MIDETFNHPYICKFLENVSHFFIWHNIQKCKLFFETLGITNDIADLQQNSSTGAKDIDIRRVNVVKRFFFYLL